MKRTSSIPHSPAAAPLAAVAAVNAQPGAGRGIPIETTAISSPRWRAALTCCAPSAARRLPGQCRTGPPRRHSASHRFAPDLHADQPGLPGLFRLAGEVPGSARARWCSGSATWPVRASARSAQPLMRSLAFATDCTVALATSDHHEMVYLEVCQPRRRAGHAAGAECAPAHRHFRHRTGLAGGA
ncbi:hypothetical protein ACU4GD_02145 [Cupriavidus basilensis]